LNAKEGSQETIVSLVGLVVGTFIVNHLPETPGWIWSTFVSFYGRDK